MRRHLVLLVALTGCKYVDQPAKVAALEKRLDEVSRRVSALADDQDAAGAAADDDGAAEDEAPVAKGKKPAKGKAAKREPARREARSAPAEPASPRPPPVELEPRAGIAWSYEGATGPAAWATLDPSFASCAGGAAQSPIDILPRRSEAPELIAVYRPAAATLVDDGHTLTAQLDGAGFIVVDGARYDLLSLHVHTPAEHTIAGDTFPMELHLVHRSKAGAVAIVAVLYDEGEPSTALAALWKGAPKARGSARLGTPFDVEALLPKDLGAHRYDGSLTTPPCSEGVVWYVLRRTRSEDERTIAALRRRLGDNARPVQAQGERAVR